ncbi:MAG: IS1182 family transposase [Spirochaetaceae bacterium]|nr:IS1182 family transposase [Spirochaetaceae bacterium]
MSERLVNVDRDTPMLLPVDLREWIPANDMVHFVLGAVEAMPLSTLKVNRRGSGSPQYPPHMMAALLIYCYSQGVFASRRIENATYRDLAVRYLTGNTHPDHDTICTFRRENRQAFTEAFVKVLELAREVGVVKVGTVSVDGTHIKANASKHKSVRYDRAGELEQQLRADIEELIEQAEQSDRNETEDGNRLPAEIARREKLREKMLEARRRLEERAEEKVRAHEEKEEAERRENPGKKPKKPPSNTPEDSQQMNLVDPDSALMRKSRRDGWQQAYNAQIVVDADGSQLILAEYVTETPSDANELEPALASIPEHIGVPDRVLADAGYVNADAIERVEKNGAEVYVAISAEDHGHRRYDYRPVKQEKSKKKVKDPRLLAMKEKLASDEGKKIYAKRKSTVEPVFGIIKAAMGFRQFLQRGKQNVGNEWTLVCTAYNLKRLWALKPG